MSGGAGVHVPVGGARRLGGHTDVVEGSVEGRLSQLVHRSGPDLMTQGTDVGPSLLVGPEVAGPGGRS
jgi:hypothetical protein